MSQLSLHLTEPHARRPLGPGAVLLPGFALPHEPALLAGIDAIAAEAPFRHMPTRGGRRIAAEMTNCGSLGWVSDSGGYRYTPRDPETRRPWPAMPNVFIRTAEEAARTAGFADFRAQRSGGAHPPRSR